MNKDIKAILSIYIIVILTVWITCLSWETSKQVQQLRDEVFEVKKITIEINTEKNEYIKILQESREYLNNEIDLLNDEIKQYKQLERLKKDLDRSN